MADQGIMSFAGNFLGGFNLVLILEIVGIVLAAMVVIGLIIWMIYNKMSWNLKIEFKLTRSGGSFISAEWGKGSFNSKKGVVFLKRKKHKKVSMQPFDIKEYLQGDSILTVEQTGVDTYIPVHPVSFEEVIDEQIDDKGKKSQIKVAIMNLKADTTSSKSWKSSYEREAKAAYAITNFLKEHGALLAMGMVLFMNLLGFVILYSKIKPG